VYMIEVDARALWEEDFAGAHDESFDEAVSAALKR